MPGINIPYRLSLKLLFWNNTWDFLSWRRIAFFKNSFFGIVHWKNGRNWVMSYELWVMNYELWVVLGCDWDSTSIWAYLNLSVVLSPQQLILIIYQHNFHLLRIWRFAISSRTHRSGELFDIYDTIRYDTIRYDTIRFLLVWGYDLGHALPISFVFLRI